MIIPLVCMMFWSFSIIFVYCEFGERMSNGFNEINDSICCVNWYTFPINMQRMIPNILIIAQKPVVLDAFGKISCKREVFTNVSPFLFNGEAVDSNLITLSQVVNGGFSYFMMLREFGK